MNCKNCQTLLDSSNSFCSNCGAKVIKNRLTLKNLLSQFTEQFLNYDNKFLQTFIHLFTKPEIVIGGYINGVRKKYVNVISYFAIALTLAGFQMFILNKFFPELLDVKMISQEGMEDIQANNISFVEEYQSIIYMLLVPVYALISKIVFYSIKTYNFTEHLVINMYLSAHFSIVSSLVVFICSFLGINYFLAGSLIIPVQIVYSAYGFKRLFNLSFKSIVIKTILFLIVSFIVFILYSIIVAILMYSNGDFQNIIEAQKAAKEASGG